MQKRMRQVYVLVCLLFLLGVAGAASAADIYVSKTGNDGTGDGSAGAPYLTVQNAIDEADVGDVIHIGNGTYEENLQVNIDNLSLVGEGDPKPVIAGASNTCTLGMYGQGFRLSNLGITNPGEDGIYVYNSSGYLTEDVEISSCDFAASDYQILLSGQLIIQAISLDITGNTFSDSLAAINFDSYLGFGLDGPTIKVSGNRFGAYTMGALHDIQIQSGTMEISDNQFLGCTSTPIDVNYLSTPPVGAVVSLEIRGNEITTDIPIQASAIDIEIDTNNAARRSISILENTISGPFHPGGVYLRYVNVEELDIRDNFISGCYRGLDAESLFPYTGCKLALTGNLFLDNLDSGVYIAGGENFVTSDVMVQSNDIIGNGTLGLTYVPYGSESLDARNNWWGDASGPYHAVSNDQGLGDEVSDNVLFEPWGTSRYTDFPIGDGEGASGGTCSVGSFVPAALLLLAPLVLMKN